MSAWKQEKKGFEKEMNRKIPRITAPHWLFRRRYLQRKSMRQLACEQMPQESCNQSHNKIVVSLLANEISSIVSRSRM